jgi:ribosomal protein S19E (S16A)
MEAYRRARRQHFREASAGIIRSVLIQLEEEMKVVRRSLARTQASVVGQQVWIVSPELSSMPQKRDDEE